jgi:hypothetical protein
MGDYESVQGAFLSEIGKKIHFFLLKGPDIIFPSQFIEIDDRRNMSFINDILYGTYVSNLQPSTGLYIFLSARTCSLTSFFDLNLMFFKKF